MNKRVFVISGGRLDAYTWQGSRLEAPYTFASNELGFSQFSLYLESEPRIPTYLLVDVVEEEFREESIPFVRWPPDRAAARQHRLRRIFRDTTYGRAESYGRETTGRRDERMLFSALTRPEMLAPWVGHCLRHKTPITGIYSVPSIAHLLLKPIGAQTEHALIVSMQRAGGLRQSFFRSQQLRLSRLAIMPRVSRRAHASYVLGEVEKTRRFLNSLRMLPRNSPLEVYVLGEYPLLEEIRRQSPDSVTTRHHLLQVDDVIARVGLKGQYESKYADQVFVHLLAKKAPPNHYASANETRYNTMYRWSGGLKAASVALLLGGVGLAGYEASEGVVATLDAQSARDDAAFFRGRYERARAQLPETPVHPREMKASVEIADALSAARHTPFPAFRQLSESLDDFPTLALDELRWRVARDKPAVAVAGAVAPAGPQTYVQTASVRGHVAPFDGNYRAALALVGRFADALRERSGVREVEVTSFPLAVESSQRMSGDTSHDLEGAEAPFEIRVVTEAPATGTAEGT